MTANGSEPRKHTISVLVENKFGVLSRVAGLFSARSRISRVGGARIMSVLAPPAGTIGNTHSSLSTQTSSTTGAAVASIFSTAPGTSLGFVTRSPMQPYASASLTQSGMPGRSIAQ